MSQSQNGWNMDRPRAGSVKRARERAQATAQGKAPRRPPPPPSSATPTMPAAMPLEDGASSPRGYLSPPPRRHMPPPSQPPPTMQLPPAPPSRARVPPGFEGKSGISRPTQAPHWPLPPGSPLTPVNNKSSSNNNNNYENEYFQPRQPDRPVQAPSRPLQAPPRPARPSRIPSMVDKTGPQTPTPVFRNPQQASDARDMMEQGLSSSVPATPATPVSRLTTSSVGSIPEFPTPGASQGPPTQQMPMPPRRSVNLGPPPAGRRGPSSYYSNATFVSPIPEESTRSHGSYASSAAMPGVWNPASPLTPTAYAQGYTDSYYDDSVTDRSRDSQGDEFGDESKLVRSASVGKKGKAALVDNKPGASTTGAATEAASAAAPTRPLAQPVQPFANGTGYIEDSTSSETIRTAAQRNKEAQPTVEEEPQLLMPVAYNATPALPGPSASPSPAPERSWSRRISAIKRPPNLDIDAVRAAEARGSITSLPDLIKRATRLAAMIERGKRPASRFENFNDYLDKPHGGDGDGDSSFNDRHQSGLSDMLAAFPPPGHQQRASPNAQTRRSGMSWFRNTSWPLIPGVKDEQGQRDGAHNETGPPGATAAAATAEKPRPVRRKCCGMPPWAFVILMILLLCAIAAAIVVPLQFFVFKTLGNHPKPLSALDQCKADLVCLNGGTNVLSQGTCACICTNGFTGTDCGVGGSDGCTTTDLVLSSDAASVIRNVTLGKAIPRLIADARANFSVPLSGTAILATINGDDLSCRAQNALVTFQGRPLRLREAEQTEEEIVDDSDELDQAMGVASRSEASYSDESTFNVTEEVLDFARVAVLYILQQEDASDAEAAQTSLQSFFSGGQYDESAITQKDAQNVTVGAKDHTVNLVDFGIDLGDGLVGKASSSKSRKKIRRTSSSSHSRRFGL
ncbi:uncharacterized protein F5Z01DRAFT_54839 [Emericellopsis atlantica]|uniref:EGF-like domain-containing protein n=1 Tax=Emericellopsis atlantica TaxID=2614577 RepID=A0A9P8CS73_9HYPO|nr:uncharacterized protein F5Z01DRAFT_54839 [Emericellopsis atlantica]KAG9255451.1 hypothetical protein F5Z01DRAFT_54839 [Emericellopsis atlantica]